MRGLDGFQKVERRRSNRRDRQRHRVIARERHLCMSVRDRIVSEGPSTYLFGALALDGDENTTLGSIELGAPHR